MPDWFPWWLFSPPPDIQRAFEGPLPTWGVLVVSLVVLIVTLWFRPHTRLYLQPSRWKAYRDSVGVYVIGHVDADGLFAVHELVLSLITSDQDTQDFTPDPTQGGYSLDGMDIGSHQFIFRLPNLPTGQLPAEVRTVLVDGTKGKVKFQLIIP